MIKLLFVCTGNICRSPTAEAHLRRAVRRAGLQNSIKTDSAGTSGGHVNQAPDKRAIECGLRRGIEMDDLRARKITPEDFDNFDLILAMDKSHLKALQALCPEDKHHKIALYLSFAKNLPKITEVPDPYFGGMTGFETVLDLIEATTPEILAFCQKKHNAPLQS